MRSIGTEQICTLRRSLERAGRIVITSHVHPDGDAVGSSVAMLSYLTEILGKDARLLLPELPPANLAFIIPESLRDRVFYGPEKAGEAVRGCSLLICMDCNGFSRTEALAPFFEQVEATRILIDHHVGPETGQFDLVFSETEISSASELAYYILMALGQPLPPACATALMAGMTTDTNNFANSVYPSTLAMAADLLAAGVDRDYILDQLYHQCSENRIRLMGHVLSDLLTITEEGAAYIILRKEDKERYRITEGETEGFVNIPLTIGRVRISVFIKEEEGLFRVSIRSRKDVSARTLAMRFFHGGGHEQAAGGKILFPEDIPGPEAARAYLATILKQFLS